MTLKPQNLIRAAEVDLRRRLTNKGTHENQVIAKQSGSPSHFAMETYAFYAPHVRKAKDAQHLLVKALMDLPLKVDRATGETRLIPRKKNTVMIYGNGALLVTAIRMLNEAKN
jgi:hypothetical protein